MTIVQSQRWLNVNRTLAFYLRGYGIHEFLLLTQGPFPEILEKKCSELEDLKNCLFLKQQNSNIQNSKFKRI